MPKRNANRVRLRTKHLELVLQSPADVRAMVEAMDAAERAQVSPDWLARVNAATAADPWVHGFSVVLRDGEVTIGAAAFKGPPIEGAVEIAYGIGADYENQGFATEAATALIDYAFRLPEIRVIRAHTLPECNASTRVLEKCGFEFIGEVVDPEDGLVWRFEKSRT